MRQNKYTPSSSGLCYIMQKYCIVHIPEHCFYEVVYYSVCALMHLITCTCPVDCKAILELRVFLGFIIQVWLKILRSNFGQVYRKYIPTLPEKIINKQPSMSFYQLISYSQLFFRTPGIISHAVAYHSYQLGSLKAFASRRDTN